MPFITACACMVVCTLLYACTTHATSFWAQVLDCAKNMLVLWL